MVKKTIQLHLAKEIDPNEFYGTYQTWVCCDLEHPDQILKDRRKQWFFEESEILVVKRGKKNSYYYKGCALLRVFYGLDTNNPNHLKLLK